MEHPDSAPTSPRGRRHCGCGLSLARLRRTGDGRRLLVGLAPYRSMRIPWGFRIIMKYFDSRNLRIRSGKPLDFTK